MGEKIKIFFYHVHKDVSDHNHGSLMVIPGLVQCLEEIII